MPFAARVLRSRALVYDMRANLNGERRYFIVEIMPSKHTAFARALERSEPFRLEDFGTILHRGWGEPDDELKAELRHRYGMYADGGS